MSTFDIGDKVKLIDDENDLGTGSVDEIQGHRILVYFYKDGYKEWFDENLLEQIDS